ncbi:Zmynd10 [Symbiodinium sp. CCMP2592]|nr:Zmynd10 [Symbiodinium sp. CCMP2592]
MWWGTPQHVHKGRAEAAEAEKMADAVPSLGSTPMDLDIRAARASANMLDGLQSLLDSKECCDIVFLTCEEQIEAHAVVLAASSPNFCKYLRQTSMRGLKEPSAPGHEMEELFTTVSTSPPASAEAGARVAAAPPTAAGEGGEDPKAVTEVPETEAISQPKEEPGMDGAGKRSDEATAEAPMEVEVEACKPEEAAPAPSPGITSPTSDEKTKADKVRVQVNGLSSSEAMHILLDYIYKGSAAASWEYKATSAQVNKEILRLATYFGFAQLHEHAARWLAKGLTTENVVDRLVTCEEFGLGLLREKITERLALKPAEMMQVCSSPEITKHPRILQDLLVQVASLKKGGAEATEDAKEEKQEPKPDKAEREKEKHEKAEKEKHDKAEKPEKPEKKHEKEKEKPEKPSKQAEKQTGKKRKAAAIAAAVRISYGPCGKDQLIVTERQKLVTNSAARILELARPGSPIAKVVLRHICKFAQDVGDGAGTLALLLAGAVRVCSSWLREGKARRQDLEHCLSYIEAIVLREDAAEVLQGLRCSGDTSTEKRFSDLARTFFGANFPPEVCGVLSRACWRWICDNGSLPLDGDKAAVAEEVVASAAASLRSGELVKVPSAGPAMQETAGSASSARVERAVVVSGVLASSSMPRECQGRAVILDDDVAPLPVRVAMPAVALDRLEKRLVVATEQLWQAGIRLVLCAAHVHEEWTGSLSQRGIAVLHLVDEEELAVLEARCGITRRVRLGSDDVASLKAAGFQLDSFRPLQKSSEGLAGSRAYWLLDLSPESNRTPASCLLLQASSSSLAIEHRLAILRLLLVVLHGFQEPCDLIAGGLAFEVALLRMARRKITNLRGPEDRNLERNAFHVLGVDDPAKALRLEGLSWLLLEASLLEVVEAFIANLLGCRGGAGARLRSAGRTARLLASAGASELDDVPGMRAIPGGFHGFVVEPGIGACEDSTPRPVETGHLKLQQLRAMCSLVRQLCRLDPSCVDRGQLPG